MPILNKNWPGWRKAKTRKKLLATLSADEIAALYWHWPFWARPDQLPPPGQWVSWLMLGGRGAGKTRAGAEWVRQRVEADARHIALIGETYHEARVVMVEGPSGLLAISPPHNRPRFLPSRHLLQWPNGAQARLFSSERPEALRGPQFDTAWCDELAKWRRDEETWDMLQFGLRLGRAPQQMITTTPRPTALLKRLIDDPTCVLTRAATLDNRANLAPGFIDHVVGRYVGTALGRQELDGDLIDDQPGALWQREIFESCRVTQVPPLQQTIIALDPRGRVQSRTRTISAGEQPRRFDLHYLDGENDYGATHVSARHDGGDEPVAQLTVPLAMTSRQATQLASRLLYEARGESEMLTLTLSPQCLDIEAGDIIRHADKHWRVRRVSYGTPIELHAMRHHPGLYGAFSAAGSTAQAPSGTGQITRPELFVLDLPAPALRYHPQPVDVPLLAAFATPWPGQVAVEAPPNINRTLRQPSVVGHNLTELQVGPVGRWDRGTYLDIELAGGALAADAFGADTAGWPVYRRSHSAVFVFSQYAAAATRLGAGLPPVL